ncbi:MAG: DNA gyrase subunit A [Planctomycetes bacterium]|nr:DNA gyrase subunit A [Planctomycetota bacterium]
MTETNSEPRPDRTVPRAIVREMRESYLTYALSVIHSRALPDVRDGLKPSHRRILVAMNDLNLSPRAKYRKCAKVAGDTSGNYHPHGESVVYPTLVRMAQDFSLRYTLVDGQGNFGSIDADPPAAMRYTEARMTGVAMEMLADLEKETVDLEPNYDETRMQPTVLPGRFPNLLCNGSEGIAVGMATSMPPHNLGEVCSALRALLDDPNTTDAQLIQLVPGPDFPTGGIIMGRSGIHQAYTTGRGLIRVRGVYHVEENKGRVQLVFTEIPYQTKKGGNNKAAIIPKVAEAVKEGRITGIADIVDESNREGIRLVFKLKKGEDPDVVVNLLWKYSPLQTTVSIINLAIANRQPRTLTLRQLLEAYLEHRKEVIRRRTRYLLGKAEERKHIVDGLLIAQENIDRIIAIIRGSKDREEAKVGLSAEFGLSDRQSQAIVDMRLGSLTGLEREKLEDEHASLVATIKDLEDILERSARVHDIIRTDLQEIEEKYGDARRTKISSMEVDSSVDIGDLISEDLMTVTFSRDGYVKRTPADTYRAQARGGRGVKGSDAKEGDVLKSLFVASTHDHLLFFSNLGQVFWKKTYDLPEAGRNSKGRAITNILRLREGEVIQTILRVPEFNDENTIVFATRQGYVKKTALEAYSRPKKGGIRAIRLEDDDEVISVSLAKPGDTVVIASEKGRAIRFDEGAARSMGRTSRGVRGIKLREGDQVVGMIVAEPDSFLMTVCEKGHGKRTPIADYPIKGRGGQGVINIRTEGRNGKVVDVKLCGEADDVMYITSSGMLVRGHIADVSSMGRNTQGVRLVNLKAEDNLAAVEIIAAADLERFGSDEEGIEENSAALVSVAEQAAEPQDPEIEEEEIDEDDESPEEDAE